MATGCRWTRTGIRWRSTRPGPPAGPAGSSRLREPRLGHALREETVEGLEDVSALLLVDPWVHADEERPLGDRVGVLELAHDAVGDLAVRRVTQDVPGEERARLDFPLLEVTG